MSPKGNTLPKALATATTLNISAYAASEDAPQVQDLVSKSKGKSHQQAPITSTMPAEKPQSKSLLLKPPPKIKKQKHAAKMSCAHLCPSLFHHLHPLQNLQHLWSLLCLYQVFSDNKNNIYCLNPWLPLWNVPCLIPMGIGNGRCYHSTDILTSSLISRSHPLTLRGQMSPSNPGLVLQIQGDHP